MKSNQYSHPRVKWESQADRERTADHAQVKKAYQCLARKVWQRLPPSVRIVIGSNSRWDGTIYLVNHDLASNQSLSFLYGMVEFELITINVCPHGDIGSRTHEYQLTWTLAHEFAHLYLTTISGYALSGVWNYYKNNTNMHDANVLDEYTEISSALHIGGGGCRRDDLDLGKTSYYAPTRERLADAVAIAWGFGQEFAHQLVDKGSPSFEDCESLESWGGGYLDSEIVLIHELLRECEEQAGQDPQNQNL